MRIQSAIRDMDHDVLMEESGARYQAPDCAGALPGKLR